MNGSRLTIAFDLTVVVVCALFARSGYYELFVTIPGVHTGRWTGPWTTSKIAVSVMLAAAVVGMAAALLLVVVVRDPGTQRMARIAEIAALIATIGVWLAWSIHFLENAGRFG